MDYSKVEYKTVVAEVLHGTLDALDLEQLPARRVSAPSPALAPAG
jgi:hypothetical protein